MGVSQMKGTNRKTALASPPVGGSRCVRKLATSNAESAPDLTSTYKMNKNKLSCKIATLRCVLCGESQIMRQQSDDLRREAVASATNGETMKPVTRMLRHAAIGGVLLLCASAGLRSSAQIPPDYALSFNGTSAYVSVPSGEALNPGTSSFTVEAWVQTTDTADTQMVLSEYQCGGNCPPGANSLYGLFVHLGGTIGAGIRSTGGGAIQFLYGSRLVADGAWHHLAMVRDQAATQLRLYVDGTLENSAALLASASGSITNDDGEADPLTIGAQAATGGPGVQNYFKGSIDEVRVWRVARSQGEIQTNMNRTLPPQPNLMAYWQFNEGGGTSASDSSGYGNTGNLVGGPAWVTSPVPLVPSVITQPATGLTPSAATLNGTVNPNGLVTVAWFEWGLTAGYGSTTPTANLGGGTTSSSLQTSLASLAPGTTYHYRIVANNSAGTAIGTDQAFVTSSLGTNSWIAPFSGKWEAGTNWSAGVPSSSQPLVQITNSGTKTITFDSVSGNTFPDSATISNLLIGAPSGSLNTLLVSDSDPSNLLHVIAGLAVLPGGTVNVTNATLTVDNGVRPVTTPNGCNVELDGAVVVNYGTLNFSNALYTTVGRMYGGAASLSLTNSTLDAYDLIVGSFSDASAAFLNSVVQLGAGLSVGHDAGFAGTLSVIGGQLIATNTIFSPDDTTVTIGSRGAGNAIFANAAVQFGNTVMGSIGGSSGSVTLQGGNLMMRKVFLGESVEQPNPYAVTGTFSQLGGNVSALELHVGVASNCTGTVNISGGALNCPTVTVGETNSASGFLNITGGTAELSSLLQVGANNSTASVSVSGGALRVTNSTQTALLNLVNGSLLQNGGSVWADYLVATNLTSALALNIGQMSLNGSFVANGLPLTVGNGTSNMTLNLPVGTHTFNNGIVVSPEATLVIGCAQVAGPITNYGTLAFDCPGGTTLQGDLYNYGTVYANGGVVSFLGNVMNLGSIYAFPPADVRFYGHLTNGGSVAGGQPAYVEWIDFAELASCDLASNVSLKVTLHFDKPITSSSLGNVSHYSFWPGALTMASAASDGLSVALTVVAPPAPGSWYALGISNLIDVTGYAIGAGPLQGTVPFYVVDYALTGTASQSSTAPGGSAQNAIDGNTDGDFADGSVTLNAAPEDPAWWEVDLNTTRAIGGIGVWFRTDYGNGLPGIAGPPRDDNFTVRIFDSTHSLIWSNTYPGRPSTNVLYSFTPTVPGRYVRVEGQHPLSTSDGYFSLAEVEVLASYTNYSIALWQGPPTQVFYDLTGAVTLGPIIASAVNAPQTLLTYQWQTASSSTNNWSDIPGATNTSFTAAALTATNSGMAFRCKLSLLSSNVFTSVAVALPKPPPTIVGLSHAAAGTNTWQIICSFNSVLDSTSATNLLDYRLDYGTVTSAVLNPDGRSVVLTVVGLGNSQGLYTLSVTNVADQSGYGLGLGRLYDNSIYARPPKPWKPLAIAQQGTNVTLTWPGVGTLQASASLSGSWSNYLTVPWSTNVSQPGRIAFPAGSGGIGTRFFRPQFTPCDLIIRGIINEDPVHPDQFIEGQMLHLSYSLFNVLPFPPAAFPAGVQVVLTDSAGNSWFIGPKLYSYFDSFLDDSLAFTAPFAGSRRQLHPRTSIRFFPVPWGHPFWLPALLLADH